MSGPAPQSWFLARDGQQFGPISEAEMGKLVELGHLQPTDLLWRDGFTDWRPALVVFPPHAPALSRAELRIQPPVGSAELPDRPVDDPVSLGDARPAADPVSLGDARPAAVGEEYRPRRGRRAVALLLLVAVLAGAAAVGYTYRAQLVTLAASLSTPSGAMSVADRKSLETPPLAGFRAGDAGAIDATLQATALWRVIKREFPEWYGQRLAEAAALAKENNDDAMIGQLMARKLQELRRQQVANGLSAKLPLLKMVASAYFQSLEKLSATSVEACAGFIRQGETEPLIVGLLQGSSEHTAHLQALSTAVFEAIADGRQVPRVHPQPSAAQYGMLARELMKKGWTQADFGIMGSRQAMAQAEPAKVCQLVHDFFETQLALPDAEVQERLLVDTLKGVFAG